jgi:methionine-rich copper-binding protein CopC
VKKTEGDKEEFLNEHSLKFAIRKPLSNGEHALTLELMIDNTHALNQSFDFKVKC